ncbi:Ger(x)C family spore germination protein [Gracilibacillus suaedae]|uniref:Ger(x)C family spore germination protein n=1 Tax=Gracilibacillus suaedae TaxID=2820273 RepID=UPI001ABE16EB
MRCTKVIYFIGIIFFLLTGCWDRKETNDLWVVTGVGLDQTKGGEVEVTVEIHSPSGNEGDGAGGEGNQAGGNKTILQTGKGVSIPKAIEDLDTKLPREILWSHTEAIVINKELAETGIREELDFFIRHPEPRLRSYVFISEGNAKDIMALLPPLERSSSEVLIELAKSEILMKVTLFDLMEMLKGESGASILPMIDILPPEEGKQPLETIAYINRSAILEHGRMIGTITDRLTRGVLWFRNEIKESTVTVKPEEADGLISMKLIKGRTELIPKIDGNQLKMTVKVETIDDVIQNKTNWDLKNMEKHKMLEKELAQKIEMRLTDTLEMVQKEMEVDIIDFGETFRQKHPDKWKSIKRDWKERFPSVEVTFEIKASVLRTGQGSIP